MSGEECAEPRSDAEESESGRVAVAGRVACASGGGESGGVEWWLYNRACSSGGGDEGASRIGEGRWVLPLPRRRHRHWKRLLCARRAAGCAR